MAMNANRIHAVLPNRLSVIRNGDWLIANADINGDADRAGFKSPIGIPKQE
jgi:hypothetical protein